MNQVEVYVPILLNFRDNSIVYDPHEVQLLCEATLAADNDITECDHGERAFRHQLDDRWLRDSLQAAGVGPQIENAVERVEVYYYHHRLILRYSFKTFPFELERGVRRFVLEHSRDIAVSKFVERINAAGDTGGPVPDESGRITSYYSYCVMFLPQRAGFPDNMENLLGSHTFRIVEVTPRLRDDDRVHVVRISIPSTNIYSESRPDRFLIVDVVNSIYQHMLYAKKDKDQQRLRALDHFSLATLDKLNVMQEAQLHALWDHAVDALGGRMVDLQAVGQQTKLFRLSVIAVVIASVSVVVSVISFVIAVLTGG
jgi:hypothetical protein